VGSDTNYAQDARLSQSRRGDDVASSDAPSPRVSHSHECSRVPRTHTRRSPTVSRVITARLCTESADHPPFSTSTVSHLRNGSACPCPRSPKRELRPLFLPRSISSSLPAAGAAWPRHRSYVLRMGSPTCMSLRAQSKEYKLSSRDVVNSRFESVARTV